LAKLCGWQGLEEADKGFYRKVVKVNTLRNRIMHGSWRLSRAESIDASNVLLLLIDWLRTNPFGFTVPGLSRLQVAQPTFSIIPLKEKQDDNKAEDKPREESSSA
jgi:hypothetical protein